MPVLLVLVQMVSLQLGAAVAKGVYDQVGAVAMAGVRLVVSAVVVCAVVRPRARGLDGAQWRAVGAFGAVIALMNALYFQSIAYLPIGVASAVELLGPLALAAALSRRGGDVVVVVAAAGGVLLLVAPGADLPWVGLLWGAGAAVCRGAYVVLSHRVGRGFDDATGLALALAVGACLLTPVAAASGAHQVVAHPQVLAVGVLVAVLSSVVPYALDMVVLRRVGVRTFGVLLALSPAVGAVVGALLLGEVLGGREVAAVLLIVVASAAAARAATARTAAVAVAAAPTPDGDGRGDRCPYCGGPDGGGGWVLRSAHRTSDGVVEYCSAPCGCVVVLREGELVGRVSTAGGRTGRGGRPTARR
ncbi:EamA family transporter [Streptomyces sp. NPDC047315]|uniref:EamA family transporter n=1 Tax=Streptomyces sp. NPDC047315 TaxID=3155142 RepID=UPI0033FE44CE